MYSTKGHNYLSSKTILSKITQIDIFSFYIKEDFVLGKAICSPIRKDSTPSFSITEYDGNCFYRDHGTGEAGNCFKLHKKL